MRFSYYYVIGTFCFSEVLRVNFVAAFCVFEATMPLFLMLSREPKRGENAPFLADLLNALWYFEINLHFCLVVLDEQVDLQIELATTFNGEPPTVVFVVRSFRIKAKGLMSVLIRSNSFGGVVLYFNLVIVDGDSFDEQPNHVSRLFSDGFVDELNDLRPAHLKSML